jgi:hypothetical protein
VLSVLSGEKKVSSDINPQLLRTFPNSCLDLGFFKKSKLLTLDYLKDIFEGDEGLKMYIPATRKYKHIGKDFLFTVLYETRKDIYERLVKLRREEEEKQHKKVYMKFKVKVVNEFIDEIEATPDLRGIDTYNL